MAKLTWAYGITTVITRKETVFPRTVASLAKAGFDSPRLFIDGCLPSKMVYYTSTYPYLEITPRYPAIRTYGNWILSMIELWIRNPKADRYAIFQDDFVTYKNLRGYLEEAPYPEMGYLSLYTFRENELAIQNQPTGWVEAPPLDSGSAQTYYGKIQQAGRGAVALVFNREALQALFTHQEAVGPLVRKPLDPVRGWRRLDGAVVESMNRAGFREYIHNPSLVQHTGTYSSIGNRPHKQALSFRGEDFDALQLLEELGISPMEQDMRLGDHVEKALSLVGITKERVEKWLGHGCGCGERKRRLNEIGAWAARLMGGKIPPEGAGASREEMEQKIEADIARQEAKELEQRKARELGRSLGGRRPAIIKRVKVEKPEASPEEDSRMPKRNIASVMQSIPSGAGQLSKAGLPAEPLPAAVYEPPAIPTFPPENQVRVGLAVESMKDHMTDEGAQLMLGLEHAGYHLWGYGIPKEDIVEGHRICLPEGSTHIPTILEYMHPQIVVMQDKREWEGLTADKSRDPRWRFTGIDMLKSRRGIFKVTILKDAQNNPPYHRQAAEEIDVHAWIVYYHPKIVAHLAPYVRFQHLIRTYHSLDPALLPELDENSFKNKNGSILSGAISGAYPLRRRLAGGIRQLPECTYLQHPGYHRKGCQTPEYLKELLKYKVAICTSSVYGYALRKIIEATAAGCVVLTDLPTDDVLPTIDGNLVRIHPAYSARTVAALLRDLYNKYDVEKQLGYARAARAWYDYRAVGTRLADDIEQMRTNYNAPAT